MQKTIRNIVEKSEQPLYFYRFCFDGKRNFIKSMIQCTHQGKLVKYIYFLRMHIFDSIGACHADELSYLFKCRMLPGDMEPDSPEEVISKRLVKLWTNFARFGNPNSKEDDELLNVEWEPVGRDDLNYLNIDRDLSVGVNPEAARMEFWDQLYDNYPSAKFW